MNPFNYRYGFGYYNFANVFAIVLVYLVIILIIALAVHIFHGIGIYKMAKNAGMSGAWLAFVPIFQGYVLGLLAERSLFHHTGKRTPLSKINLFLAIGTTVLTIFIIVLTVSGARLALLLFGLIIAVAGIAAAVFNYYCYFYIYKDFVPDNEVLLLILSIFIPIAAPIIFLIYMNAVPVSVAGRQYGSQPRYNQPGSGPGPQNSGYGQGGYGPQNGYGPQGGYQQPIESPPPDDRQGPEL